MELKDRRPIRIPPAVRLGKCYSSSDDFILFLPECRRVQRVVLVVRTILRRVRWLATTTRQGRYDCVQKKRRLEEVSFCDVSKECAARKVESICDVYGMVRQKHFDRDVGLMEHWLFSGTRCRRLTSLGNQNHSEPEKQIVAHAPKYL